MNTIADLRRDPGAILLPLGLAGLLFTFGGWSWGVAFFLAVATFNLFLPPWIFSRHEARDPRDFSALEAGSLLHPKGRIAFGVAIAVLTASTVAGAVFADSPLKGAFCGALAVSFAFYLADRSTVRRARNSSVAMDT